MDLYQNGLGADITADTMNDLSTVVPISVVVQIAMAKALRAIGVEATTITSHSTGDIVAAWYVGSISMRKAMILTFLRVEWINKTPTGGMLAWSGSEEKLPS